MALERTLVLVKPDGVRRGLTGEVIRRIEAKGYTLVALELRTATPELLAGHYAVVNFIPYNTVEGLPWKRPSITRQERFADILRDARVSVTLRREKGHDIAAACGQLRLKTEKARETAGAEASP